MNNKQEKDFIIGEIHGSENLNRILKETGFKVSENRPINIADAPEKTPIGEISDLPTTIEEVKKNIDRMQKANIAHHDAQYKKMYPSKK